ncbi:MAG TPA: hypothetical protein VMS12_02245 [Thermoanaerobaculia bacterium]|nr:hypothetical protein [Thermoanaerobaculia bacterium]
MEKDQKDPTASDAGEDYGSEESSPRARMGKAREYVSSKVADASGSVRDGYTKVRSKVEEVDLEGATEQVRAYVRSNPGKALLISVGAGFLIGLLLRRGNDD